MNPWAERTADQLIRSLSASGLTATGIDLVAGDDSITCEEQSSVRFALVKALEQLSSQLSYDMAYGLSHELNNPLANIAARARLLVEDETSEARRIMLGGIVDQAMRGCEMIADLMLLARPPALDIKPWNLNEIVGDLCAQARPWIDARRLTLIAPEVKEPSRNELSGVKSSDQAAASKFAPIVAVDRHALLESLWCVCRNAIEAASSGIELNLNQSTSPEADATAQTGWLLSIQDDGPGLSAEALERAFHPYYSGRESGRGLGLGLCKARRTIEQMGGILQLKNSQGACVTIWLPTA